MYIYIQVFRLPFSNTTTIMVTLKIIQGDVQLWASLFCLNILVYTFYFVYLYITYIRTSYEYRLNSYMRTNTDLLLTITYYLKIQ